MRWSYSRGLQLAQARLGFVLHHGAAIKMVLSRILSSNTHQWICKSSPIDVRAQLVACIHPRNHLWCTLSNTHISPPQLQAMYHHSVSYWIRQVFGRLIILDIHWHTHTHTRTQLTLEWCMAGWQSGSKHHRKDQESDGHAPPCVALFDTCHEEKRSTTCVCLPCVVGGVLLRCKELL